MFSFVRTIETGLTIGLIAGFVITGSVLPASASKRVALVIGISEYKSVSKLANPVNDANAIGRMLQTAGFSTTVRHNLTVRDMRRAVNDFAFDTRDADVALVFFAGHGIEVDGKNYLIPSDAVLQRDIDVQDEAVTLDRILSTIEPARQLRLVILDACRDNPFARTMKRTLSRSLGRGLAGIEPPSANTLVAFAARAGSTADDGAGDNSPYTAALLKHLTTPGLDLRIALGRVRDDVIASTRSRQEPFLYGSLGGADLPLVVGKPANTPVQPPGDAQQAWQAIQDGKNCAFFDAYIRRFDGTFYADLARAQMDALKCNTGLSATKPAPLPPAPPVAQASQAKPDGALLAPQPPSAEIKPQALLNVAKPPPPVTGTETTPAVGIFPEKRPATSLSKIDEQALKPKDRFKECDACPDMVVIESGRFVMGAADGEPQRKSTENPQRHVTFARPFAVGRLAVTFDQWEACVADRGCNGYSAPDDAVTRNWGRGTRPVVRVSWKDAQLYISWLSRKTGKRYRLLTEAEREYVTRAGTNTAFWWGDMISPDQANYNGDYAFRDGKKGVYRKTTLPADSFLPNPWGLYQVHGNTWDWVQDCWTEDLRSLPADGSAHNRADCRQRVIRGGSWINSPNYLRAASREKYADDTRSREISFRVARNIGE